MIVEIIIIVSIFIGLHYLLMNREMPNESKTKQPAILKSLEWGISQSAKGCPPGTKPSLTGAWGATICCESGKATKWGFGEHCLYQKNGTYCYTDEMCASGNCNGWGGITQGICV